MDGHGHTILPPSSKKLRVRPDGGMGPIPLDTGWNLGPVPKHIAAWALAAKRAHASDPFSDVSNRTSRAPADSSVEVSNSSSAVGESPMGLALENLAGVRDPVLGGIANGMPNARLPLVPGPDETFVSRDTGVTGELWHSFLGRLFAGDLH